MMERLAIRRSLQRTCFILVSINPYDVFMCAQYKQVRMLSSGAHIFDTSTREAEACATTPGWKAIFSLFILYR